MSLEFGLTVMHFKFGKVSKVNPIVPFNIMNPTEQTVLLDASRLYHFV